MKSCIAGVQMGDGRAAETTDHFILTLDDRIAFSLEPFMSSPEGFLDVRQISVCCSGIISYHGDRGEFCSLCGETLDLLAPASRLRAESPRGRDGFIILDMRPLESQLDYTFDTLGSSLIIGPLVGLMTELMNQACNRPRPFSLSTTRARMAEIAEEWDNTDLMASISLKSRAV